MIKIKYHYVNIINSRYIGVRQYFNHYYDQLLRIENLNFRSIVFEKKKNNNNL